MGFALSSYLDIYRCTSVPLLCVEGSNDTPPDTPCLLYSEFHLRSHQYEF